MAEMKPLASLSSGLLARKGQARPAMRRQGMDVGPTGPASLDDLGWNDMGGDPPASPAREAIESLREAVEATAPEPVNPATMLTPEPAARVAEPVARVPESVEPEPAEQVLEAEDIVSSESTRIIPPIALRRARRQARSRDGKTATGKAAFTLRLDADRHLKLRLAAALERASAQTLVTRALDRFLEGFDDLDQLLGDRPGDKD